MYTAIKVQDGAYKFKSQDSLSNEIVGLNKINIFVGQNNSGKSRFMRSIFTKELLFKDINYEKIAKIINEIDEKINALIKPYGNVSDLEIIKKSINNLKYSVFPFYKENNSLSSNLKQFNDEIQKLKSKIGHGIAGSFGRIGLDRIGINIELLYDQIQKDNDNDFNLINANPSPFKKVYIPMLRGLKNPIKDEKKDLYEIRTEKDYFYEKIPREFEIFTGLTLYEDIKNMLLGSHEKRENIKEFEKFIGEKFFSGETITLIPNIENDVLYVKIGDNPDLPIYELGDGIQTIIINTFPLFKYKDENLLLFIEEPEIGLHPGMQRILLNAFNQIENHQIFFTTHSNHFLDIALDKELRDKTSIYQINDTNIPTENNPKFSEKHIINITQNKGILDLLGVRNSSVFLSNCIIWVEGVSDRIYIRKFLELYQNSLDSEHQKYEEDKHYSIVEYGGGNIVHFNFGDTDRDGITVSALNKNNFLVADNDLGKKQERLNDLEKILGSENIFFDTPEIENLISYDIFKLYFEELKDNGNRNWKIKENIGLEKEFNKIIFKEAIGLVVKKVFIELKSGIENNNFTDRKDISIIGNKSDIAEKITGLIDSYEKLSEKSKELTEQLYEFIKRNNL